MKKLLYILYISILLTGCAQDTSKILQKEAKYHPKREMHVKNKKEPAVVKNYDKKLNKKTKEDRKVSNRSFKSEEVASTVGYDRYFSEISQQKLQQLFEVSLLLNKPSTQTDMKEYAQKHAKRLFIASKNVDIDKQISQLHLRADSILVQKVRLIDMTEIDGDSQVGKYQFEVIPYRNGNARKPLHKTAEIYFEITDLQIDGTIRKTIKGRILKIY